MDRFKGRLDMFSCESHQFSCYMCVCVKMDNLLLIDGELHTVSSNTQLTEMCRCVSAIGTRTKNSKKLAHGIQTWPSDVFYLLLLCTSQRDFQNMCMIYDQKDSSTSGNHVLETKIKRLLL